MTALQFVLTGIGLFLSTYMIFVLIFWAKANQKSLPKVLQWVIMGLGGIGFIGDVVFNIMFATVIWLELPDFKGAHFYYMPTLTERMRDTIKAGKPGYRMTLSIFICKYMLEPWDFGHCNLARYLDD